MRMRKTVLAAALAMLAPCTGYAQKLDCTDVQAGTAQGYSCLNQQLGAIATQTQRPSSATDVPYSATSPSNVTGQFNESATRNRLGANFGKSVTPQRPVVTYAPAFAPH
jgi:hypothetical protein